MWRRRKTPLFRSAKLFLAKSHGINPFEAKGLTVRPGGRNLVETICNDRHPCSALVILYATLGLHRHNFLKGTNYQKKYNKTTGPAAATYHITSVAKDPATSSRLTFLTRVTEQRFGKLVLTCYFARPRGTKDRVLKREFYLVGSLPQCPPQNPFRNTNRFYLLKKSEWQDNAWIRLYLDLAVATTHRGTGNYDLSNLTIVKVAMDTTEDVNEEGLNAKNAIFYIRYKDSCEARVGEDVDRIAIVRRAFNEQTGCFSLVGQNQSSDIIRKNDKIRSAQLLFRRHLGVHKPWRLSSPRQRKAFKIRGLGLARRQNQSSDIIPKNQSAQLLFNRR